jgi:IS30 family transposase
MDANFQEILDALAQKPPRSRLEPYRDLIEELLKRGRTYREIRKILADKCDLRIALSTLYSFMVPHSRAARRTSLSERPNEIENAPTREEKQDGNQRHINDVRQRIEALKRRKATEKEPEGFSYDPDQPLRLLQNTGKTVSDE